MKQKSRFSIKSLPKWVKISVPIVMLLILLAIIGGLYLDRIIYHQLKESVRSRSKGLYELDYTKVRVNLFSRSIVIRNASLSIDSGVYKSLSSKQRPMPLILEGRFPSVRISGIHWTTLLFSKKLAASRISVLSPSIILTIHKSSPSDSANAELSNNSSFFGNGFDGIELKSASVQNANLDYRYYEVGGAGPTFNNFQQLTLELGQQERSSASFDKGISWEAKNISFSNYESRTGDSMYLMNLKNFNYSSNKRSITIGRVSIRPRLSESDYAKLPFQKERNDFAVEGVILTGVNLDSIMSREVSVEEASIQSGHWNIFLNRIPPLPPPRKNVVPSQTLLKVSNKIYLKKLKIKKLQLDYREYNTKTEKIGEIRFNDVTGTASNITNMESRINKDPKLSVNLTARLMGKGNFKADFQFMLNDTTGKFSVAASLAKMDATYFNPGFVPLNQLEIKKGTIDELRCEGSGNENGIKGDVFMLYRDLHIAVMEKDKNADTLKRKTFVSLVANIFVKNDNPKEGEPVRTAKNLVLKRDPRKSYFNLLWMALFTGIGKIATGKSVFP